MGKQAWAQNAIITKDDGRSVRFKPRCPKCGFVPVNRDRGGTASEGIRAATTDCCDKCGEYFEIIISRS